MISRCPSCAGEVDDEARVCPSCHWDFVARKRLPPGSEAPASPAPPTTSALPPARQLPPLEIQHFADVLEDSPAPKPDPEALRRFKESAKPAPAPAPAPRPAAKTPAPGPKPGTPQTRPRRPSARAIWATATLAAFAGLGVTVWRLLPQTESTQALPMPKPTIAFPKNDDAVRVDAARLLERQAAAPAAAAAAAPRVDVTPAPKAAPAPEPAPRRWLFQGTAFDVLTLRPVPLADLSFEDAQGHLMGKASTDEAGRYSVDLFPAPDGYRMSVSHPDYQARYLDDLTPSIRLTDKKLRRQLAKALPQNEKWTGKAGGAVRRDIALIPSAGD